MYSFKTRVRYTELNHRNGLISPSSIINYFQDCSTFQSEDLNLGLSYLQEKNRVWLMTAWQVQINRPIRLGDTIEVGTWPYAFKGFYGYRNFVIKDENGELLSLANSIWVYLDTQTNSPVRVPDNHAGYELEPPYPMEYLDRKITITGDLFPHPSFPVIKSNIDSYNHVNNGQYIKMAEEYLPDDFIASQVRVEYKKQAVLGDIIIPKSAVTETSYCVALCDQSHKPYAIVEFTK